MCQRVADMTKTVLVSDAKKLKLKTESPLYKRQEFLSTESNEGIHEVIMDQQTITDNKPVHVGVAILQHSKLMLLKFVEFLRTYLVSGSYALVYGG